MSTRPFFAARLEAFFDRRAERFCRALGWRERVIPYTAYGNQDFVRVLGRVVLAPQFAETHLGKATESFLRRRGWRNFVTAACIHAPYTLTIGNATMSGITDRGGFIDHRVTGHNLPAGWSSAQISVTAGGEAEEVCVVEAPVQIVAPEATVAIVSDVDDTVLSTMVPRPLAAAWNSFVRAEMARQAVPAMAHFYDAIQAAFPHTPIFYLSTGAWNTHGFLDRFLGRHRYPSGPMLLTDWGPTNTGWFRSGVEHKRKALLQLSLDFPHLSWFLVGDDGQHDPEIYREFAVANPDRVMAIAIRQLSPAQHYLAHGSTEPLLADDGSYPHAPILRAPDGRGLLQLAAERYHLI
ncbi:MAG: App1 family protein [Propioniciclava sp.]